MGWIDYDADDVVEMIEAWRPGPLGSEAAYEDALYMYISRKLGKGHVARRRRGPHGSLRSWASERSCVLDADQSHAATVDDCAHFQLASQRLDVAPKSRETVVFAGFRPRHIGLSHSSLCGYIGLREAGGLAQLL